MFRCPANIALRFLASLLGLAALAALAACGGGGTPEIPAAGIAFVATETEFLPAIYVVSTKGGEPVRIAQEEDEIRAWPTWSPDGEHLAFISWPNPAQTVTPEVAETSTSQAGETATPAAEETPTPMTEETPTPATEETPTPVVQEVETPELMVANADGSEPRVVARAIFLRSYEPTFRWSPDASRIVYQTPADISEQPLQSAVRIVDVASGRDIPLVEERLGFFAAWSPDGTKIAFGAYVGEPDESGEQEDDLFVMDSDGGNLRLLASRPGTDMAPVWSPDGKHVAWWRADPEEQNLLLFIVDVDSGEVTALGEGAYPTWSPDGKHIACMHEEEPPEGVIPAQADVEIYLIDTDTGERTNLTNDPGGDFWPTWSPDGTEIVFISTRDNLQGEIYLMNADGSNVRRLTDNSITETMLTWRPPRPS